MYERRKSRIPFRDIALQLLIVVLFILVLLWLFPTKKNVNNYVDSNQKNNNQQNNSNNTNDQNNYNNNQNNINTSTNSNSNVNNDNTSNSSVKSYEYVKETAGSYGEYGSWSDWSTNYVAASNTVEVETDVRRVQTGISSYQVEVGTTVSNEVVGNIKTNKVLSGYNAKYIRTLTSLERLNSVDNYKYILTNGVQKYDCADKTTYTLNITGTSLGTNATYDQVNGTKNQFKYDVSKKCKSSKLYYESYTYQLFEIVPIYTSSTKDVYGEVKKPVMETKTTPIYGDVTYYRYRTRTYIEGSKDIKWSNSQNDQSLLNQGYKLTGNIK